MTCEPGERDPQFERVQVGRAGVGVVVRAVQPGEAQVFDCPGNPLPARPVQAVLPLDHDGEFKHRFIFSLSARLGEMQNQLANTRAWVWYNPARATLAQSAEQAFRKC